MSDPFDFEPLCDSYAVFGNPIRHSKSPQIHSQFALQTQQHIDYQATQVDPGGFEQAIGNFFANGGKGANITVPFKQEAWELVDDRSERAQLAGAVNTIAHKQDGSNSLLYGDNTDGIGLVTDLQNNLHRELINKRILLLGAGGASRGVILPLLKTSPSELIIANRTAEKAVQLAQAFTEHGNISGLGFGQLDDSVFDIIINATSASLTGDVPAIDSRVLHRDSFCYDMMYGAQPTAFLKWCAKHGCTQYSDGLGMLVEQAAESFYIWRGVKPQTQSIIREIRQSLT